MLVLKKAFNGIKVEKMKIVMRTTVEHVVDIMRRRCRRFRGTTELLSYRLDETNILMRLITRVSYRKCLVQM